MAASPHKRRPGRAQGLLGALALATAALVTVDAAAQQQLRIPRSNVEVDWSVIDELDSRPAARPALVTPPRPGARARVPASNNRATTQAAPSAPAPRVAAAPATPGEPTRLRPPRTASAASPAPGDRTSVV